MARRRYQKGSLFLRGKREKVWVARRREDVILPDGRVRRRRVSKVIGTLADLPTRRRALRELERWVAEVNSPAYRPRPIATFREYALGWLKHGVSHLKPSTVVNYKTHVNRYLLPFFGTMPMKDIGPEAVERFVATLESRSPRTRRNVIMTMRSLWTKARKQGVVAHDALAGVDLPQIQEAERTYLKIDQAKRVIEAAQEPDGTLYWLAAETGFRAGELCALRVGDVDVPGCSVTVQRSVWNGRITEPKSKRARRRVAISPKLAVHLERYIQHTMRPNDAGYLFATRKGTPANPNDKRKKPQKLLASLGFKRCGFHAFRHGSETEMDRRNVPLGVRQTRLGHQDARLTLGTYTHPVVEDERAFVAELGGVLAPSWTQAETPTKAIQ